MAGLRRLRVRTDDGVFTGRLIERRRCASPRDPNADEDEFVEGVWLGRAVVAIVVLIAGVVAAWLAYGYLAG